MARDRSTFLGGAPGAWVRVVALATALSSTGSPLAAQARVDSNLVYGMFSGLALLMDVHHPVEPNGYGVVLIPGSGWQSGIDYAAEPLKDQALARSGLVRPVVEAGYTVFVVSHRAAPTFRYPAAVEDVQRAVRYVRYHAADFSIDPARIGAVGHSSGGHLAAMLGVLEGEGDETDPDPVNRERARVQAVAVVAAATDLDAFGAVGAPFADVFVGAVHASASGRRHAEGTAEARLFREASPISWVSRGDAPTLLVHGDADTVVPFEQALAMQEALDEAGVDSRLARMQGGGHVWNDQWTGFPEMIPQWLDRHLRTP